MNGETSTTAEVVEGDKVEKPADPTKDNYIFGGWYKEAECTNAFDFDNDVIDADTTLYAKWTVVKYAVTFDSNGGSIVEAAEVEATSGKVAKPADPTKAGFKFDGWYTDAELKNSYDFETPVTSDITLHAKWLQVFSVLFQNGSANGETINVPCLEGTTVAQPANPTWAGYRFDGWFADSAFTTAFDFTQPITAATVIYAKWTALHTVTFNTNGADAIAAVTVDENAKVAEPTDPTKAGFKFDGWYTDAAFTNRYDFDTAVTGDITLHAKWLKYISVRLMNGANNGETSSRPVLEGTTLARPADPTWEGYRFEGWYADEDFTTEFDFSKPITDVNGVTIYAKWVDLSSEPTKLDYTLLDMARTKAAQFDKDRLAQYTETGKSAFTAAKAAAEAARTDVTKTQDEVDSAARALNQALLALRRTPSSAALDALN